MLTYTVRWATELCCVVSGVFQNWPVWLHLLQELHLILDTGAGLQLLYHHLGGAEARIDFAQQNLRRVQRTNIKLEGCREAQSPE